jgi:hypothetical protein
MPAWAGPLERALAEETTKGAAQPTQTEVKSLPPHLHNTTKVINGSPGPDPNSKLDPVASIINLRVPTSTLNSKPPVQQLDGCQAPKRSCDLRETMLA